MSAGAVGQYAFHIHHEKLYEKLTEPIENRIKFVEGNKDKKEVATRLKLMRVVKDQTKLGDLIYHLESAWKAWNAALTETLATSRRKDDKGQGRAEDAAEKAYADLLKQNQAIYALHKAECEPDCPWDAAQSTIFPKAARV
jgi:hypothetical protein